MVMKRKQAKKKISPSKAGGRPNLKKDDQVMVIAGGNSKKRPNQGKIGRILGFTGKNKEQVLVEGVNLVTRHRKQTSPDKPGGKIEKEAPIHVSNVMFYAEKIKQPVKLRSLQLEDGSRVRAYKDPDSGELVQV